MSEGPILKDSLAEGSALRECLSIDDIVLDDDIPEERWVVDRMRAWADVWQDHRYYYPLSAVLYGGLTLYAFTCAMGWATNAPAYRWWGIVCVTVEVVLLLVWGALHAWNALHPENLEKVHRRRNYAHRLMTRDFFLLVSVLSLGVGVWARLHRMCWASRYECAANMETTVVERSAHNLVATLSPYIDVTTLSHPTVASYNPYSPFLSLFGLPSALWGAHLWTDARLYICGLAVIVLFIAWAIAHFPRIPIAAWWILVLFPAVHMNPVASGIDLLIASFCVLAIAALMHRRPIVSGVAAALALSCKWTALPIIVILVVLLLRHAQDFAPMRLAARQLNNNAQPKSSIALRIHLRWWIPFSVIVCAAYIPAYVMNSAAFVENVVRYPLGMAQVVSSAQGGTPGQFLASFGHLGRALSLCFLVITAIAMLVWIVKTDPRTIEEIFFFAGMGMLMAMLLMPASRFGYAIYPAMFSSCVVLKRVN